jgi:hypothetical protein
MPTRTIQQAHLIQNNHPYNAAEKQQTSKRSATRALHLGGDGNFLSSMFKLGIAIVVDQARGITKGQGHQLMSGHGFGAVHLTCTCATERFTTILAVLIGRILTLKTGDKSANDCCCCCCR